MEVRKLANPFATGDMSLSLERFEPAEDITVAVLPRKHFFQIFRSQFIKKKRISVTSIVANKQSFDIVTINIHLWKISSNVSAHMMSTDIYMWYFNAFVE